MDKMSFEEFTEAISPEIEKIATAAGRSRIIREKVNRLTGAYESISVYDETSSLGICINLNELYEKYEEGASLAELCESVKQSLEDSHLTLSVESVRDYAQVKEKLFIRVSNAERNREMLAAVPHKTYEEFAITAHVLMQLYDDTLGSVLITNQLLKAYGISEEQLFADAEKNAVRIFPPAMMECSMDEDHIMCALTNEKKINGAASMFYEGMWEELIEGFECDLLVIPSSIHEMMIVPYRDHDQIDFYRRVLHEANRTCVNKGEDLSENIYLIMKDEKVLKRA